MLLGKILQHLCCVWWNRQFRHDRNEQASNRDESHLRSDTSGCVISALDTRPCEFASPPEVRVEGSILGRGGETRRRLHKLSVTLRCLSKSRKTDPAPTS